MTPYNVCSWELSWPIWNVSIVSPHVFITFQATIQNHSYNYSSFSKGFLGMSRHTGHSMRLPNSEITHAFLSPGNEAQTFVPAHRVWCDVTLASSQSPPTLCSLLLSCIYSNLTVFHSFPMSTIHQLLPGNFHDMWLPPVHFTEGYPGWSTSLGPFSRSL